MTQPAPNLSIIIVSFNTCYLLKQCLTSLRHHCRDAQIIVIDNASRDGSAAMVQQEFPQTLLVQSPVNLGFAGANNLGLTHASGEFVVLLNSDTVLEDDALIRCAGWMRDHPELGACSPRLMGVDGLPQQCLFRLPSVSREWRKFTRRSPPPPPGDHDPDTWLAGTALVLRREALASIGGYLDAAYFMYWEDADLSARLRRAGWEVAAYPDAQVLHYGGASGGGADQQRRPDLQAWYYYGRHRWFYRNRGLASAAAIWLIDAINIPRLLLRAALRPQHQYAATDARVLATSLFRCLLGRSPRRPGPDPTKSLYP